MFTITIIELPAKETSLPESRTASAVLPLPGLTEPVKRFEQTVDDLDIPALVALVNRPRRARRSDAGKPRGDK